MLTTLLLTRLRYYHNYLRHHFDRVVWIEIGLIVLLFLYLTGRSPADIGYNLKFLQAADFSARYAGQWVMLLPLFYLIAEILAVITLRPTGEWQILGALPIPQQAMTNYHLLRHLSKMSGVLLLGTAPFWIGSGNLTGKTARFTLALGVLLALQLAGFRQAGVLRNTHQNWRRKTRLWLPVEAAAIFLLVISAPWWRDIFITSTSQVFLGVLPAWGLALLLLVYIHRVHLPGELETGVSRDREGVKPHREFAPAYNHGLTAALMFHDLQFLWRCKRSIFIYLFTAAGIIGAACVFQKSVEETYASSIVIAVVSNFLLINALLVLFEHDAGAAGLLRMLPTEVRTLWKARWLFAAGFMATPMLIPILIIPVKFGVSASFFFFLLIPLGVPMIFAALYCNAGFGLFPNIKYCGVLLNISLGLILLFWFYMPFGTLLLLAMATLWIRKSQRHFQLLEIGA